MWSEFRTKLRFTASNHSHLTGREIHGFTKISRSVPLPTTTRVASVLITIYWRKQERALLWAEISVELKVERGDVKMPAWRPDSLKQSRHSVLSPLTSAHPPPRLYRWDLTMWGNKYWTERLIQEYRVAAIMRRRIYYESLL